MNYELINLKAKKVAGLTIRTTNEDMKCIKDMEVLWGRFYGENIPQKLNEIAGAVSYGVYNNYESDITKPYDYTAAMDVLSDNQDEGVSVIDIPAGKYALFSAKGDMVKIVGELWQTIWEADLQRTFECDFESYTVGEAGLSETLVEIYISVK